MENRYLAGKFMENHHSGFLGHKTKQYKIIENTCSCHPSSSFVLLISSSDGPRAKVFIIFGKWIVVETISQQFLAHLTINKVYMEKASCHFS
jgi:hypothetical protein